MSSQFNCIEFGFIYDTEKNLCYTLDNNGNKVNVKKNYSGQYPLLAKGNNTVTSTFIYNDMERKVFVGRSLWLYADCY